jgi:hypothetical protein
MYAIIIQHQGVASSRPAQTLVAYDELSQQLHYFGREARGLRGRAGKWFEVNSHRKREDSLAVYGQPVAIQLTDGDYADLRDTFGVPNLLFQKSDRKVRDFVTPSASGLTVRQVLQDVEDSTLADTTGRSLGKLYGKKPKAFRTRTASVARSAQPTVVKAVAVDPVAPVATPPVVAQPEPVVEPVVQPVQPVVAEPVVVRQPAVVAVPEPSAQPVSDSLAAALLTPQLSDKDVSFYQERTDLWQSGISETKVYDTARSHQRNVVLIGHAGTGKTSSARRYAALRNLPLAIIECDIELNRNRIEGGYVPTGKVGELVWADSNLVTAIQQPSVVLLNELSRGLAKSNALLLGLLNERQLVLSQRQNRVIKVHPECIIIADMNPQGYAGVNKQDKAMLERFNEFVTFEYDVAIDKLYCKSDTFINEVVIKWRAANENDPTATPFSHRLVKNFQYHVDNYGLRPAVVQLLDRFETSEREVLKSLVLSSIDGIASELGVDSNNLSVSL